MSNAVSTTRDGDVLRVTLTRPDRRNAFDAATIDQLTAAFADVGDARVVLLSGEGPSFSAGADLDWMRASVDLDAEANRVEGLRLATLFATIDACPAPVVAAVHGHALGGGAGLVATVDIAVAQTDTMFGFTEVRIGLIPATISPYVIDRIGTTAARRYLLTAELFDAAEAQRIGLVSVVADDAAAEAERLVETLLTVGPNAVRITKQLVRERPSNEELARLISEVRASAEGQAGLQAFLAREDPPWRSARS
ncbi:MAG: enoyl-CoA hydratase/isomerase family protein [Thermoleophilia bacterium]|nr:enoyl-CoA hydratase/isomerase family protein [Thermoleophilia bacterium]